MLSAVIDAEIVNRRRLKAHEERFRDPDEQAREIERCRQVRWRFWSLWVHTVDPHHHRRRRRAPRYGYLQDMSEARARGRRGEASSNMVIFKPRAHVCSWWAMAEDALGHLAFDEEATRGIAMSYKLQRVDDGGEDSTHESLFGKLRYAWGQLPRWWQVYAPLKFVRNRITNTRTGAVLSAEPAGSGTGRGGQYDYGIFDEMGEVKNGEAILSGVVNACPRNQLWLGTPKGMQGALWHFHESETADVQKVFLDWWMIPDRRRCVTCGSSDLAVEGAEVDGVVVGVEHRGDCAPTDGLYWDATDGRWRSPWFNGVAASLPKALISQELERDFTRSAVGRVYPAFQRGTSLRQVERVASARHYVFWDFGVRDQTALIFCQVVQGRIEVYETYENASKSADHYCQYVAWVSGEYQDADGKLWLGEATAKEFRRRRDLHDKAAWGEPGRYRGTKFTHVGDPSGSSRDAKLMGWFKWLALGARQEFTAAAQGVTRKDSRVVGRVKVKPAPDVSMDDRVLTVQWLTEHGLVVIDPAAQRLAQCLENYRWKTNDLGEVTGQQSEPLHDQYSHLATALEFGALVVFGVRRFVGAGVSS